jgi:hypothetical protein
MKTKFHGNDIVEIIDDNIIIKDIDDVFSLLFANNCSKIIIKKENIVNDIFDLSTGIAEEILQKFSTQIIFINTTEEAIKIFSK